MAALVECFVTHGALVWPISRVCSLVNLKCACLTETFTTYITSVGLFTCINTIEINQNNIYFLLK